jgi:hypothetical protein
VTERLTMELSTSETGQFQGRAWPEGGGPALSFTGVLEMLGVLEELSSSEHPPGSDVATR